MALPKPTNVGELYLAAILAELQTLNTTMSNLAKRSSSAKSADTPQQIIQKLDKGKNPK